MILALGNQYLHLEFHRRTIVYWALYQINNAKNILKVKMDMPQLILLHKNARYIEEGKWEFENMDFRLNPIIVFQVKLETNCLLKTYATILGP